MLLLFVSLLCTLSCFVFLLQFPLQSFILSLKLLFVILSPILFFHQSSSSLLKSVCDIFCPLLFLSKLPNRVLQLLVVFSLEFNFLFQLPDLLLMDFVVRLRRFNFIKACLNRFGRIFEFFQLWDGNRCSFFGLVLFRVQFLFSCTPLRLDVLEFVLESVDRLFQTFLVLPCLILSLVLCFFQILLIHLLHLLDGFYMLLL